MVELSYTPIHLTRIFFEFAQSCHRPHSRHDIYISLDRIAIRTTSIGDGVGRDSVWWQVGISHRYEDCGSNRESAQRMSRQSANEYTMRVDVVDDKMSLIHELHSAPY
jgi:hypothetical protein